MSEELKPDCGYYNERVELAAALARAEKLKSAIQDFFNRQISDGKLAEVADVDNHDFNIWLSGLLEMRDCYNYEVQRAEKAEKERDDYQQNLEKAIAGWNQAIDNLERLERRVAELEAEVKADILTCDRRLLMPSSTDESATK